jgi:DNA (cytosine-5)-methyltransferase 1
MTPATGLLCAEARATAISPATIWRRASTREDAQTIDMEEEPAPALTAKSGGQWHLNPGRTPTQPNRRTYPVEEEPAPTIAFGHDAANWCFERPATTLQGDPRVFTPGGHIANDGRDNSKMKGRSEDAIRLEIADALVLQSFPPDYPVAGSRTAQFRQVGDAVPPLFAAHILAALLGLPRP